MKLLRLLIITLSLSASTAFASAKVIYHPTESRIELSARIYFYGSEATSEIAQAVLAEINQYWNGGSHFNASILPLTVPFGNLKVRFQAIVSGEVISEARALALLDGTPAPEINFINILAGDSASGDRSAMDFICGRTGTWYLSDDLTKSTTAAHEFGHGLCLDHPRNSDWRKLGQPPIMTARGSLVDSPYQWDPHATSGLPGGTLNPYKRRVTDFDVGEMHLQFLPYDSQGVAYLRGFGRPQHLQARTD